MRTALLAGVALVTVGCASHPAPTQQVTTSLAAVRGAEEAGALQVPEAALHVKLAEEQIARSQQLMKHGEHQRAEGVANRALQDAELAIAIAREDAARRKLEQFAQANQTAGGEQPAPATAPAMPNAAPAAGQTATP